MPINTRDHSEFLRGGLGTARWPLSGFKRSNETPLLQPFKRDALPDEHIANLITIAGDEDGEPAHKEWRYRSEAGAHSGAAITGIDLYKAEQMSRPRGA